MDAGQGAVAILFASSAKTHSGQAFTEPLLAKFDFHFDSSRKTNDAAHPEWYYQQVSEWIQANVPFVRVLIDPILAVHAEEHNLPPDCALVGR